MLAKKIMADGCHLGQKDMGFNSAKKILGNKIIGISCYNSKQLIKEGIKYKANYIALGAFFPTKTKKAKYKASFKDRNPKSFEGNFNAIKRETCAACHTQDQAGSDCLICHNYHVGKFGPALTSTPMAEGMK